MEGVKTGQNTKFCKFCGEKIDVDCVCNRRREQGPDIQPILSKAGGDIPSGSFYAIVDTVAVSFPMRKSSKRSKSIDKPILLTLLSLLSRDFYF